jgi:hypothetical protein
VVAVPDHRRDLQGNRARDRGPCADAENRIAEFAGASFSVCASNSDLSHNTRKQFRPEP